MEERGEDRINLIQILTTHYLTYCTTSRTYDLSNTIDYITNETSSQRRCAIALGSLQTFPCMGEHPGRVSGIDGVRQSEENQ